MSRGGFKNQKSYIHSAMLWGWGATVNEVNNDEIKVLDKFLFRRVSVVYFTAQIDV